MLRLGFPSQKNAENRNHTPDFHGKSGVGYPNVVSQHTKDVNIASLDYVRAVFIATMRLQIAEFDQSILLSYHHNLPGGEVTRR